MSQNWKGNFGFFSPAVPHLLSLDCKSTSTHLHILDLFKQASPVLLTQRLNENNLDGLYSSIKKWLFYYMIIIKSLKKQQQQCH